ncbi:hypothetical protein NEOKW01_1933 [Nematocida sp. AWRm80]|nr:hypothetical protein NEOKW01_1933 [Nematocida sp. AWRm80]
MLTSKVINNPNTLTKIQLCKVLQGIGLKCTVRKKKSELIGMYNKNIRNIRNRPDVLLGVIRENRVTKVSKKRKSEEIPAKKQKSEVKEIKEVKPDISTLENQIKKMQASLIKPRTKNKNKPETKEIAVTETIQQKEQPEPLSAPISKSIQRHSHPSTLKQSTSLNKTKKRNSQLETTNKQENTQIGETIRTQRNKERMQAMIKYGRIIYFTAVVIFIAVMMAHSLYDIRVKKQNLAGQNKASWWRNIKNAAADYLPETQSQKIARERATQLQLEQELQEKEEAKRLEQERAAKIKEEQEKQKKLEQERLEGERLEQEKQKKLEAERLEKEKEKQKKLEQEKLEAEKQKKLEQERLEQEKKEAEKQKKLEQEKQKKLEQERQEQEKQKKLEAKRRKEEALKQERERKEKEEKERQALEDQLRLELEQQANNSHHSSKYSFTPIKNTETPSEPTKNTQSKPSSKPSFLSTLWKYTKIFLNILKLAVISLIVFILGASGVIWILHKRYVRNERIDEYTGYLKDRIYKRAKHMLPPQTIAELREEFKVLSNSEWKELCRRILLDSNIRLVYVLRGDKQEQAWEWAGPLN